MAPRPDASFWIKQAGLLTAIPMVLLVGPVVGYYVGTAVDHHWSWSPAGLIGGIVLGFVASARVTIELIQQAKREQRDT